MELLESQIWLFYFWRFLMAVLTQQRFQKMFRFSASRLQSHTVTWTSSPEDFLWTVYVWRDGYTSTLVTTAVLDLAFHSHLCVWRQPAEPSGLSAVQRSQQSSGRTSPAQTRCCWCVHAAVRRACELSPFLFLCSFIWTLQAWFGQGSLLSEAWNTFVNA